MKRHAIGRLAVPWRRLGLGAALWVVACSGNGATSGDAGTSSTTGSTTSGSTPLPCDVNAVVVSHCQTCHSNPPLSGAPMPLVTWEDFQGLTPADSIGPDAGAGAHVWQTAETRIHDDQAPMPPAPNARLDSADLATMDAWLNGGTPKGTEVCAEDASAPANSTPTVACGADDIELAPASPWSMPTDDDDDYVCYSVNIPTSDAGTNHIVAITPDIVNKKIVHHVLLFEADPTDTSITSTPALCSAGGSLTWRIVYGWAPGGGAMQTPANVGFPYDATTKFVVQVHYNNINHLSGQTDTSGFSFCSTDQPVQYDADVVAFGTQKITIPARSTLDETSSFTVSSELAGIHLFAAFPHMHQIGQGIETEQLTASGSILDLGRNDPWNFNAQIWFPIDATLNTGDVVNTRCAWQNDTDSQVTFGQDTENEMCYSFTAYYPRVTSSTWSWALPALQATVATTPDGGLPMPDAGWTLGDGGAP